jgi:hypothetical protein
MRRSRDWGATLTHGFSRALAVGIATLAASCFAMVDARALTYKDILGNWCSATARLEFTRNAMGVLLFSDRSHSSSRVTRYEFGGTFVTVYWEKDGSETSSDFDEFSSDGRTMFLQPNNNVPRREYHRC